MIPVPYRSRVVRARAMALVSATGLLAAFLTVVDAAAATAAPISPETSASQRAVATGQAVPVPEETDAYTTVTALPDGTFQRVVSNVPERVHRDGTWVPVDATLTATGDGSYSPAASAEQLTLSGGGSTQLATLHSEGHALTLSWPTVLPAPTVNGATATYPDVLPGVDLRVTPDTLGGMSEMLVVNTASAAANPALAALQLTTSTSSGLQVSDDVGDNINVTDSAGTVVFHSPTPMMWDSGVNGTSSQAQSTSDGSAEPSSEPPPGADIRPVGVTTDTDTLTLTPDQDLLTGADTQYPVIIDPYWTGSTPDYAWVQQAHQSSSNWNSTENGEPAVGYEGWETPYGITRSFFQFTPNAHTGYHIFSAHFKVTGVDSPSGLNDCDAPHTMVVNSTAPIDSGIHWGNEPAIWSQQDVQNAYNGYGSCPNKTTSFDVTDSIVNDSGQGTVTYRIRAQYEDNKNAYMRFNHVASLTIHYNRTPDAPTGFAFSPAPQPADGCDGTKDWIPATSQVTLSAHVSDPDGSQQEIQGQFQFWDKGATGDQTAIDLLNYPDAAAHSAWVPGSGATVSIQVDSSILTDGHRYGSNARTYDGADYSAGTSPCYFWYDASAPSIAVSSTDYPKSGEITKHPGDPGVFHLSATETGPTPDGDRSGLDHLIYSTSSGADLADGGGTHLTPTGDDSSGTYDLTLTPTSWGGHYLFTAAVDKAGNQSPVDTYSYYIPAGPTNTVDPGDVDNNEQPDLLAANGNTDDLELYPTLSRAPATPVVASPGSSSPDGTTWANTLIAHRSSTLQSPTGGQVDDLWAHKEGGTALYLYINNVNNGGIGSYGNHYFTDDNQHPVARPTTCADTDCTGYNATDWSTVTTLLAPGDMDGDGLPDVVTVENGTLWLYPGSTDTATLGKPHQLGTGFAGMRLVAPGDDTGDGIPDLWGVNDSGAFNLYYTSRTAGDPTSVTLTTVTGSSTAFTSDKRPLITSPGDADGNGLPDLYTTSPVTGDPDAQLWSNSASATGTNPPAVGGHAVVDDTIDWGAFTNLA